MNLTPREIMMNAFTLDSAAGPIESLADHPMSHPRIEEFAFALADAVIATLAANGVVLAHADLAWMKDIAGKELVLTRVDWRAQGVTMRMTGEASVVERRA